MRKAQAERGADLLVALAGRALEAVVVLGMSAGGLAALQTIVRDLPNPLPGALVIAHHVSERSMLPELIGRWSGHTCRFASPGEPLRRGASAA